MNKFLHIGVVGLATLVWVNAVQGVVIDPDFAIDPASPSIDGNITPDDVLQSGPVVFTQGTDLGLVDDFFLGNFDVLNALSYGQDRVTRPPRQIPLFFSVDRVAVGLPGTAVDAEAQPGVEEAAGDVFRSLPPFGSNSQFIDEQDLGLIPGFFGDDLDAVELDTEPDPFTYFSIDSLSATNDFGAGHLAADILVSLGDGQFGIFADHPSIGLLPTDDLDALVLNTEINQALFSLSTFSPSTFTFTGNDYIPGEQFFLSPADILWTDFSGHFELWAAAADIGMFPEDEVNALDTVLVPEPATFVLLGAGLVGLWATTKKIRRP